MTRLMWDSRVSWATVCRAVKGANVQYTTAVKLSRATGGAVPVHALTSDRVDASEVA